MSKSPYIPAHLHIAANVTSIGIIRRHSRCHLPMVKCSIMSKWISRSSSNYIRMQPLRYRSHIGHRTVTIPIDPRWKWCTDFTSTESKKILATNTSTKIAMIQSGAGDGANIFTPSVNDSIGWKWLLVRPDEGTFFIIRSSSHKPYNHRQWDKLDGNIIQGSIVWNIVGDLSVALRGVRAKVDTNTSR